MKNCNSSKFNIVIQLNNILPFLALCLPSTLYFNSRMKAPEFSCSRFLSQDTDRLENLDIMIKYSWPCPRVPTFHRGK